MSGSQSAVFTRLRDSDRESWRPRSRAFSRKFLSKYIPNAGLFYFEILQPVLRQTFNSRYVSNKVIVFIKNLQINIWDFFNYVSCSTWCSNDASNNSTGLHDSWKYSVDSAKFDKGKTLAGMWGHHYEASLEDSCLVPAASRGWAGHSVELQQPTMPEQERRSHGFEVTAIWIGWHVASPQGDLGGGADAEATQICSPTSEQENGQRWRKAEGVEWTLKEEHFLFKLI